jgi:hypothetical protein
MKLFGGMIGWRASKQPTVTTSTTEAEFLALSYTTREALVVSRLVEELGVDLGQAYITIKCDNTQTIRILNEEITNLRTNLRHSTYTTSGCSRKSEMAPSKWCT